MESEDQQAVERLAHLIMRSPISPERMAWDGEEEVRSLLTTPGEPLDFAKSGNYTYAALGDAGMYMLDTRGCRRPYQNPDQPSAEVE